MKKNIIEKTKKYRTHYKKGEIFISFEFIKGVILGMLITAILFYIIS